jgi:hypothetical protein
MPPKRNSSAVVFYHTKAEQKKIFGGGAVLNPTESIHRFFPLRIPPFPL